MRSIGKYKIMIAGVGGQGIVYLTTIIGECALEAEIPVAISEIHGLSQRGGVVTSGIGLGFNATGMISRAGADMLIGLEPLEMQRCVGYLHSGSVAIYGNYRLTPHSSMAGMAEYPDPEKLHEWLQNRIKHVSFVRQFPASLTPLYYNLHLLGVTTLAPGFPFTAENVEQVLCRLTTGENTEKSLRAFRSGLNHTEQKIKTLHGVDK